MLNPVNFFLRELLQCYFYIIISHLSSLISHLSVNVLFSAKYSEVPVFTGISSFQQNLRFFKFNFWDCYQAAVDRSLPTSIALSSGNS